MRSPSFFFLPLIPYSFQRMLHTQRMKKKVGVLFLDREEKKSATPLHFSLPPNPPNPLPLSMPAMHATHET